MVTRVFFPVQVNWFCPCFGSSSRILSLPLSLGSFSSRSSKTARLPFCDQLSSTSRTWSRARRGRMGRRGEPAMSFFYLAQTKKTKKVRAFSSALGARRHLRPGASRKAVTFFSLLPRRHAEGTLSLSLSLLNVSSSTHDNASRRPGRLQGRSRRRGGPLLFGGVDGIKTPSLLDPALLSFFKPSSSSAFFLCRQRRTSSSSSRRGSNDALRASGLQRRRTRRSSSSRIDGSSSSSSSSGSGETRRPSLRSCLLCCCCCPRPCRSPPLLPQRRRPDLGLERLLFLFSRRRFLRSSSPGALRGGPPPSRTASRGGHGRDRSVVVAPPLRLQRRRSRRLRLPGSRRVLPRRGDLPAPRAGPQPHSADENRDSERLWPRVGQGERAGAGVC